jgi:hypothetical protein
LVKVAVEIVSKDTLKKNLFSKFNCKHVVTFEAKVKMNGKDRFNFYASENLNEVQDSINEIDNYNSATI